MTNTIPNLMWAKKHVIDSTWYLGYIIEPKGVKIYVHDRDPYFEADRHNTENTFKIFESEDNKRTAIYVEISGVVVPVINPNNVFSYGKFERKYT